MARASWRLVCQRYHRRFYSTAYDIIKCASAVPSSTSKQEIIVNLGVHDEQQILTKVKVRQRDDQVLGGFCTRPSAFRNPSCLSRATIPCRSVLRGWHKEKGMFFLNLNRENKCQLRRPYPEKSTYLSLIPVQVHAPFPQWLRRRDL